MSWLAAVLLLVIAITHYGGEPLSLNYPAPDAAARAIYYISRSFEGATQYALILFLAIYGRVRFKRPRDALILVMVCFWGFVEQMEAGICRLAKGIENTPRPGSWRGLCDDLTGLPLYSIGLACGALLAAGIAIDLWERKND